MSSTTEQSRKVVEAFYASLAALDVPAVTNAFAEDTVVEIIGHTPVSGRHVGRDALIADAMGPIFAALDMEQVHFAQSWEIFAAEGDRIAARMTAKAATKSGKRYDGNYCHLFRIDNGLIAELYEYLDTVLVEDAIFDNALQRPQAVATG
jgi:uncharacterized protein